MRWQWRPLLAFASVLLACMFVIAACIDIHPEARMCQEGDPPKPATRPLTYDDVEPIFAAKCARCHNPEGSAPFSLRTYDDVKSRKDLIRGAVATKQMPPWPPASCCGTFDAPLALTDDELGSIMGFVDQGAQPSRADAGPSPIGRHGLDRVDTVIESPNPYLPRPVEGAIDETRCFLLDWPEQETRYVTGIDIHPGVPGQMHHALVLVASPSDADYLRERDDDEPGPGFRCPGGIVRFKDYLGGSFFQAQTYPPGLGHRIDPGDKIILTMHYSPPAHASGFVEDKTKILLRHQREPTKQVVALSVYNPAWLLGAMRIPAGEREVTFSYEDNPVLLNGNRPFLLHGVNLHMHERGAHGQVVILRDNGERECLLQIDRWNHDWQGDYTLATPKRLEKGDRLLVSCTFDNSDGHQRLRGGRRESPRNLNWDEEEEMCVAFISATQAD
jgi:hypothetical protein